MLIFRKLIANNLILISNYSKILRNYNTNTNNEKKLKIAFLGTDLLSKYILTSLLAQKKIDEICVITSSSSNPSQKNKIIDLCNQHRMKYLIWSEIQQNRAKFYALLKQYDLGVVASFGHLIPSHFIQLFPYGIVNVHPSLLPRWRGASPIVYQVLFGDKQVGCTLMKILPKHFDIGPILSQKKLNLTDDQINGLTSLELLDKLGKLGGQMIDELFNDHFEANIVSSIEQSKENVTYAHKIASENFYINWTDQTMNEIDAQYRALHELRHLKTMFNGNLIKLTDLVKIGSKNLNHLTRNALSNQQTMGSIFYLKNENLIAVRCKDGFVGFKSLIYKKKLTAKDFYNGYIQINNNNDEQSSLKFDSMDNKIKENIYKAKLKN